MKSLFIIAAMAFMVSNAAMAQKFDVNFNAEAAAVDYSFDVNNNSMARYLKLNDDQSDKMEYVFERFSNEIKRLEYCKEEKRAKRLMSALSYNLSAAHSVLSEEQYRKYLVVLNGSLKNKGLDTILSNSDMAMAE